MTQQQLPYIKSTTKVSELIVAMTQQQQPHIQSTTKVSETVEQSMMNKAAEVADIVADLEEPVTVTMTKTKAGHSKFKIQKG
ncbi:unnamed protein product [Ambrosiozyma monospora]|uniref:Unnamed protein product n=1 Tax=Ambrosiozyma monospora TaxID=43982 RepID=A0A9W7DJ10_AMBMO|nr:unnamed protein product [Ambrosiozyma monospora]